MKISTISLALLWGAFSAAAYGAPGEWWEVTTKMEMPGMPFAMPQTTTRVCIAKGAASDPQQSMQDKDCKMTDVKVSGNKTSYKVRCVRKGEEMNGTGEITSTTDSYNGTMHLSGRSGGENINMTTNYRGKRVGPACDSSQPSPEMAAAKKQIAQNCETSGRDTAELVNMADIYLAKNALCADKSNAVCSAVRRDAGKDANTYGALVMQEQNVRSGSVSVAKSCGLDMAATTKSICKTLNGKNYRTLSSHCPAEAKTYRATKRKKECEGRDYTSRGDLSRCMNGSDDSGGDEEDAGSSGSSSQRGANPAGAVIDGAKALKGLFGF